MSCAALSALFWGAFTLILCILWLEFCTDRMRAYTAVFLAVCVSLAAAGSGYGRAAYEEQGCGEEAP